MSGKNHNIFEFDDVRVEPAKFKIWKAGAELALEPKTFRLLLFLIETRGRLVEKNELLDAVWHDTFVTENAMTREIAKLRKVLGDDSRTPRYIQTVHTQGYYFIAEVLEIDGERENGNKSPAVPTTHLQSDESEARAQDSFPATDTALKAAPKNRRSIAFRLSLVFGALALLAAGAWFIRARYQSSADISVRRVAQVTNWSGLDFYPSISPDGNTVAFSSDRTGSFEIYVKQLGTGAGEVQLTTDGGQNSEPAFSPNGNLLAFYSKRRGGIWVVPITGGAAKQITDFGSHPAWSPDGSQIAFQLTSLSDVGFNASNAQPPSTIWLVPAEGGEPKQLTQVGNPVGGHGAPSFSPDGKRIAFDSSDYGTYVVWSVSLQGDDLKKISGSLNATDAVYAPDGKSIYFVADRGSALQKVNVSEMGEPIGEPVNVFRCQRFARQTNFNRR